ncbi:MAG: glycosyl transferase [Firmicutes bacterium HGW-Firmicutes-1]|jgi:glycosyltransferase involved in cell wall biosynthesis|nr:MAG: glycosyl transferase [Firmicutes bacterium HGW-Firmicutes-1]
MKLPLICFITWNRAGLTALNLRALLDTNDDFELYIIDNNSQDDTWQFIQSVKDERIKCKKRFDINRGEVYAINYALSKRNKEQYFILVENDIRIKTKDWVTKFLDTMETFPELGLLGATNQVILEYEVKPLPELISKGEVGYYGVYQVRGCCNCFRPELLDQLGYFNEETGWADRDNCFRINKFTNYVTGYSSCIEIELTKSILCNQCLIKDQCSLLKDATTCFEVYKKNDQYPQFTAAMSDKHAAYTHELLEGKRSIYCASIHDPESIKNHVYHKEWALDNFQFFIDKAN